MVITMISKTNFNINLIKGELSPVAVIKLIFTGAILWAREGFITSINFLLKMVTLAPVSTRQTKHLSWSLA